MILFRINLTAYYRKLYITDEDNLRASHDSLDAYKATGTDGVTKKEYGLNLEENIKGLSAQLKRMGYRPERSQYQCLDVLGRTVQQKRVNHLVEADIKEFFDTVNHERMIKFPRHRIGVNGSSG